MRTVGEASCLVVPLAASLADVWPARRVAAWSDVGAQRLDGCRDRLCPNSEELLCCGA